MGARMATTKEATEAWRKTNAIGSATTMRAATENLDLAKEERTRLLLSKILV